MQKKRPSLRSHPKNSRVISERAKHCPPTINCRLSVLCLQADKQSSQMKKSSRSALRGVDWWPARQFPPTRIICRGAGNWLRFGSKTAIRAILGDRKQENPGCLESFLEDGLKNAGFFWSFMAKSGVRSETPRNTVRFPLLFSTE